MKNSKNTKSSIALTLVIFGGIIALMIIGAKQQLNMTSRHVASTNNQLNSVVLTASEGRFDFGTISMADGNVNHMFTIKNSNSNPLTITRVYTSCMCTTAMLLKNGEEVGPFGMPGHGALKPANVRLEPDQELVVNVTFDPAAHGPAGIGMIKRAVYLENSAGSPLRLEISANVKP